MNNSTCARCSRKIIWGQSVLGTWVAMDEDVVSTGARFELYPRSGEAPLALATRSKAGHSAHVCPPKKGLLQIVQEKLF